MFGDRLVSQEDRAWLQDLQQQILMTKFGWKIARASNSLVAAVPSPAGFATGFGQVAVSQHSAASAVAADGQVSPALFDGDEQVLFGDFIKMGLARHERVYEQLPSIRKLAALMERYLHEFNTSRGKASSAAMAEAAAAAGGRRGKNDPGAAAGAAGCCKMELVFFKDAVLHVVRLARVLRQPRCVELQVQNI